jgi:nucleoid DNA-binding protein
MRTANARARGALYGTLVAGLALAAPALSQPQPQRPPQAIPPTAPRPVKLTLAGQIAAATKVDEKDVDKVLQALGPAVAAQLTRGQQVNLPGLGTLRVVQIPEHRDLVGGRPASIAASNTVEFLPAGPIAGAANAPGAKPAEVVPPFEYNPLPGQTPSPRTPSSRIPGPRTP